MTVRPGFEPEVWPGYPVFIHGCDAAIATISDANVSEVEYTAFANSHHRTTAHLIGRRVLDANTQDPCSRSGTTTRS
jgi:hypothetical protein